MTSTNRAKASVSKNQCTIGDPVHYLGVGLQSGRQVSMKLKPAAPYAGIHFWRSDKKAEQGLIAASWHNIVGSNGATVIANEFDVCVSGVEGLLGVLRNFGIDNLLIEINGAEIPVLDGGGVSLVKLIQRAGIVPQSAPRFGIWIEQPIACRIGDGIAILEPGSMPRLTISVGFFNQNAGLQQASLEIVDDVFSQRPMPSEDSSSNYLRDYGPMLGGARCQTLTVEENGDVGHSIGGYN